jgi:hypothetical protein
LAIVAAHFSTRLPNAYSKAKDTPQSGTLAACVRGLAARPLAVLSLSNEAPIEIGINAKTTASALIGLAASSLDTPNANLLAAMFDSSRAGIGPWIGSNIGFLHYAAAGTPRVHTAFRRAPRYNQNFTAACAISAFPQLPSPHSHGICNSFARRSGRYRWGIPHRPHIAQCAHCYAT